MGRLSDLPDALLLKILALMPTKAAVDTMVLSKRWQFLWKLVPRLEYDDSMYQDGGDWRFLRYMYSSLLLHEAPVLESFSVKLGQKSGAVDIGACVTPAVNRSVRELIIEIDRSSYSTTPAILPRSLYTGCRMLVNLKLNNAVFVDASSSAVSFPSLKTLTLLSMKYPGDEFICKFLSGCPVLEDLFVLQCCGDNVGVLVVRVPSLRKLGVRKVSIEEYAQGLVINTPSLEFLDIIDQTDGFCAVESSMPKIAEAHLNVTYADTQQLLGSLTSAFQLSVCLETSMDPCSDGKIFSQLDQLKLCTCDMGWMDLLMRLLKHTPKLTLIVLEETHGMDLEAPRPCWNEPSRVPECLSSSLEMFCWRQYGGSKDERKLATFILRNSAHLEIATFNSKSTDPVERLRMLTELSMSPRRSSTCTLQFLGKYKKTRV
ncbi:unnamed protein product [Microthlaspi erraticum]|uniref:F-box domain-containing protein n=1 Tax=Microthlaspi erraticum TaxID=1685480 RepID=A0A6D2KZR8_9BRAS|nr:unnamed protein product [Microthlaspi erraticum]